MITQHSQAPWVLGRWTVLDEDRPSIRGEGRLLWTLVEGEDCLAIGPYGRKSPGVETLIRGTGWEADGIQFENPFDLQLVCAAPELMAAIEYALNQMAGSDGYDHELAYQKLAKAFENAGGKI